MENKIVKAYEFLLKYFQNKVLNYDKNVDLHTKLEYRQILYRFSVFAKYYINDKKCLCDQITPNFKLDDFGGHYSSCEESEENHSCSSDEETKTKKHKNKKETLLKFRKKEAMAYLKLEKIKK